MTIRPLRSVLYIPGDKPRALDKARNLAADAIIFDLEDAVAVSEKKSARTTLVAELGTGGYGARLKIVRINGLDTDWAADDLAALNSVDVDAVLLPKANSKADIETVANIMDAYPSLKSASIWAMMETPIGILNALEIAQAPRMGGFVMGTNDLNKDLNTRTRVDRLPMIHSLGHCILAAKAAGIAAIDGVYNAFKDNDGLRIECGQGRDMGFDGKTLIHPAQLAVANDVFAPTQVEIDLAQRQIEAFDQAQSEGKGVAIVDGKIVENLHIVTAQATLAKAKAISDMEG